MSTNQRKCPRVNRQRICDEVVEVCGNDDLVACFRKYLREHYVAVARLFVVHRVLEKRVAFFGIILKASLVDFRIK
jgi:hypothetical protein